jgi:hypothetical protein
VRKLRVLGGDNERNPNQEEEEEEETRKLKQ